MEGGRRRRGGGTRVPSEVHLHRRGRSSTPVDVAESRNARGSGESSASTRRRAQPAGHAARNAARARLQGAGSRGRRGRNRRFHPAPRPDTSWCSRANPRASESAACRADGENLPHARGADARSAPCAAGGAGSPGASAAARCAWAAAARQARRARRGKLRLNRTAPRGPGSRRALAWWPAFAPPSPVSRLRAKISGALRGSSGATAACSLPLGVPCPQFWGVPWCALSPKKDDGSDVQRLHTGEGAVGAAGPCECAAAPRLAAPGHAARAHTPAEVCPGRWTEVVVLWYSQRAGMACGATAADRRARWQLLDWPQGGSLASSEVRRHPACARRAAKPCRAPRFFAGPAAARRGPV